MKDLKNELAYMLLAATEELKNTSAAIERTAENIKSNADRATAGARVEIANYIAQDAVELSRLISAKTEQRQTVNNILKIADTAGIDLDGKADAVELLTATR